jgi:hypothetical protein
VVDVTNSISPPVNVPAQTAADPTTLPANQTAPQVTPGSVAAVTPTSSATDRVAAGNAVSSGVAAPIGSVDARSPNDASRANASQTERKAGAGVNGATSGQTPPVTGAGDRPGADPSGIDSSIILGRVALFMPGGKYSDPEIVCALAMDGTNKVQNQDALAKVDQLNNQRRAAADVQQAKAQQSVDELAKSRDDGLGSFLKDLAMVVGGVLVVTGAGAVAGGILIGLVLANELATSETGHGIGGLGARAVGLGDGLSNAIDLYETATLAALTFAVSGGTDVGAAETLGNVVQGAAQGGAVVTDRQAAGHKAAAAEASADAHLAEAHVKGIDDQFAKVVAHLKKLSAAQTQMNDAAQETARARGRITRHVA